MYCAPICYVEPQVGDMRNVSVPTGAFVVCMLSKISKDLTWTFLCYVELHVGDWDRLKLSGDRCIMHGEQIHLSGR